MKFELTKKQVKKFKKWNNKHSTDYCGNVEISFSPTGIGTIVTARKLHKGKTIEINLTDYDSW